jgi:hypothetical protein
MAILPSLSFPYENQRMPPLCSSPPGWIIAGDADPEMSLLKAIRKADIRSDLGSDCHSHHKYKPELDTLHPRIEDEVRLADTFGEAPPVPKGRPGIYSRCIEGTLVGRPVASTCSQS